MLKLLLFCVALFASLGLWQVLKSGARPGAKPSSGEKSGCSGPDAAGEPLNASKQKSKLADKLKKRLSAVQGEKIQSRLRCVSRYQVTLPLKHFTGRKGELLETITKNREGMNVLLIVGNEGVGKTTFGTMVVEKLIPFHPHSQIYFDMNWAETPERQVAEAMAHVVQTYRPESRTPMSDRELAAAYRTVLRGQKTLLFFDNVSSAAQIQKLLPPKSCTLVITTRVEAKPPNSYTKELFVPPPEDSRDLLLKLCPRVGFWTAEIAKSCGHNPLAVTICARYLGASEDRDPGAFSTQLRDQAKRLERGDKDRDRLGLESALTLVLSFLPEKTTLTLVKMMAFPHSFDSQAEGFVCEDRDGDHLQILSSLGIIQYESDNSRYRIHPMIRRLLDRKEFKPYLLQAQTRHATYFMTTLEHIHQLHNHKDRDHKAQALNTFDLEWTNIREGQAWSRDHCTKDGDAAKVCNSYAESGMEILRLRRPPRERLAWFEAALSASRFRQDTEAEKNHLLNIGRENIALGEFKKGADYLENVVKLCEDNGDIEILTEAYHHLGLAWTSQGKFEKGIQNFLKELEFAPQQGGGTVEIRAAEELGKTHMKMNQPNEGMNYLEQALAAARQSGDTGAETRILLALGNARIKADQYDAAMEHLRTGMALATKTKNRRYEASFLSLIGDVHVSLGEYPQASSFYDKAVQLYRTLKDSGNEADTLGRQGIAWIKSDNLPGGIQAIEKAIGISKSIKNVVGEMTLLSYLGAALLEVGNIQLATEAFDRQLSLAKKTRSSTVEAKAMHNLGQLEEKQGNLEKAVGHMKTALYLYEKAGSPLVAEVRQDLESLQLKLKKPVS